MKSYNKSIPLAIFFILLLVSTSVASDKEDIEALFMNHIIKEGIIKKSENANLNGIEITSSLVHEMDSKLRKTDKTKILTVLNHSESPSIQLSIGTDGNKGNEIIVFQKKTNSVYIQASDYNGDGILDLLSYSSLSESGDILLDSFDYGVDGQIDLKINFKNGVISVHRNGRWYKSIGSEVKGKYFLINGQKVSVKTALKELKEKYNF